MENGQGQQPQNTQNNQQQVQSQQSNQPETVLRDGNLKATVWKNEGENGPYYNTTLSRTWQDDQGKWHDAHSFSGAELLRVSELARGAYAKTNELRQSHNQQQEMPLDDAGQEHSQAQQNFKQKRSRGTRRSQQANRR